MTICSILGLLYCCAWGLWASVLNRDYVRAEFPTRGVYYTEVFAAPGLAAVVYAAMLFG